MTNANVIAIATVLVLAGPVLLGLAGWARARGESASARPRLSAPGGWSLTMVSALVYTLAFNLTFFIQELFLVLPKALTPGLRPTLFHNNHIWAGDHPLAGLFQGTGVLATLLSAVICALLWRRYRGHSTTVRLFLFWMAYSGLFMALPQFVVGAISPQSDVGMAMAHLGLGTAFKTTLALAALAAIPLIGLRMARMLLELAEEGDAMDMAKSRCLFVFRVASLPALVAMPLIIAFRIPREWIEVAAVPAVVTVIGVSWIQAGAALRLGALEPGRAAAVRSIAWPLGAVLCLLLVFQLLLRPGVRFY
jgi:hypothetical protein